MVSTQLLLLRAEIEVAADSADRNDQDGERQNQLGAKFSRHGQTRNPAVREPTKSDFQRKRRDSSFKANYDGWRQQ